MITKSMIDDFISQPSVAVVGVSRSNAKPAYMSRKKMALGGHLSFLSKHRGYTMQ